MFQSLSQSSVKASVMCILKRAIASVRVGDTRIQANILFDEGAQWSFYPQALANQLGSIPYSRENVLISTFGGDTTQQHAGVVCVSLETNLGDVNISALVVPTIAAPLQTHKPRYPYSSLLKWAEAVNTASNLILHF